VIGGEPLHDPERLAEALRDRGFDALLVASPPNVRYLTRFGKAGGAAALVLTAEPRRALLALPAANVDFLIEDVAGGVEPHAYGEFFRVRAEGAELTEAEELVARVSEGSRAGIGLADLVGELAKANDLRSAVIGGDSAARSIERIEAELGGARLSPADELLRELRASKTAVEVDRLRAAAAVAERAISATVEAASAGATQRELAARFAGAVVGESAEVRLANVSLGRSSALGNANVPDDTLADGEVIRFDVGAIVGGYGSDLARCFSLGEPPARATEAYAALAAGQAAALREVRAGAGANDVFERGLEATHEAGLPGYERTNLGHGIGIVGDGYDAPLIAPDEDATLAEGAVICVETPYYELGFCGLQVEDMVVVSEDGYEPLTHLDRELVVL
jgi:Xaa-Pro aminopeptidase